MSFTNTEIMAHEIVIGWVPLERDSVVCVQKMSRGVLNRLCNGVSGTQLGRGKHQVGKM